MKPLAVVAPTSQYLPATALQSPEHAAVARPAVDPYVPVGHTVQLADPRTALYRPCGSSPTSTCLSHGTQHTRRRVRIVLAGGTCCASTSSSTELTSCARAGTSARRGPHRTVHTSRAWAALPNGPSTGGVLAGGALKRRRCRGANRAVVTSVSYGRTCTRTIGGRQ